MSDESQITPYKAFVNCIKMGDELNSDDGDELLEIVEGEFDRKLANGLRWRVFSLDTETSFDHEDENEEAKPRLPENEERVSPEPIGNVMEGDKPKEEPSDAADAVKAEAEANSSNHEDGSPDDGDSLDKPVSIDSDEDYVIARNCKESSGLPSLNKIKAAFNSIHGALLLDTIGATHLVSEKLLNACACTKAAKLDWSSWLEKMERRGYLLAYEVDGETYYCVSQMLSDCLRRSERSNALQKIWAQCLPLSSVKRNKKIPSPLMVGTEKIAKDTLHKYISWLNVCIAIFKIDMPIHVEWDHDRNAYRTSGSGEAKDTIFTDVIFVTPDEYASAIADEEASVCSYGDALPDQKVMSTAAAKNCFFYTDKLYLWSSGEWQVFDWKADSETAAPSIDGPEQKDEAEDAEEPGETHEQPAAEKTGQEAADVPECEAPQTLLENTTAEDSESRDAENEKMPETESEAAADQVRLTQDNEEKTVEADMQKH